MDYLALTGAELDSLSGSIQLNPTYNTPGGIITGLTPYFFGIAGFALAIYIVLSGFAVMNSKGDPRALEAAKAKLTYAVVGFFLVFSSYWLVQIVGRVLDIQIIQDIFG